MVLYRCEIWSLALKEEHSPELTMWGEHLELRWVKEQDAAESCTMSSFIIYTPRQILVKLPN
jgi:hypothetical protein